MHDFDVWSFFHPEEGRRTFPGKRRVTRALDGPTFLSSSLRINLLGRTIPDLGTAHGSLSAYLAPGGSTTSRALAERPAFILYPVLARGAVCG